MERYVKFFLIFNFLFLASCSSIRQVGGFVPFENEIHQVKVGVDTKSSVIKLLGEPLNASSDGSSWTYIQQETQTFAFLKPKVVSRTVLDLTFDKNNILREKRIYGIKDSNEIDFKREVIVTEGRKLTFWQQIFGNVGNFSGEQFIN